MNVKPRPKILFRVNKKDISFSMPSDLYNKICIYLLREKKKRCRKMPVLFSTSDQFAIFKVYRSGLKMNWPERRAYLFFKRKKREEQNSTFIIETTTNIWFQRFIQRLINSTGMRDTWNIVQKMILQVIENFMCDKMLHYMSNLETWQFADKGNLCARHYHLKCTRRPH